jgi:hypothetical protein
MRPLRAWRRRRSARASLVGWNRHELRLRLDGRQVVVDGEMLVPQSRRDPRFVVYGATRWDDGTPVSAGDAARVAAILDELRAVGVRIEIKFEVRPV